MGCGAHKKAAYTELSSHEATKPPCEQTAESSGKAAQEPRIHEEGAPIKETSDPPTGEQPIARQDAAMTAGQVDLVQDISLPVDVEGAEAPPGLVAKSPVQAVAAKPEADVVADSKVIDSKPPETKEFCVSTTGDALKEAPAQSETPTAAVAGDAATPTLKAAPKTRGSKKCVSALLKGLKNGEVSKIVDHMEEESVPPPSMEHKRSQSPDSPTYEPGSPYFDMNKDGKDGKTGWKSPRSMGAAPNDEIDAGVLEDVGDGDGVNGSKLAVGQPLLVANLSDSADNASTAALIT